MSDYQLLANCIRALSMDAVQRANSGHPGMPMGFADAATVLAAEFLKYAPNNPLWHDRDRFVLSAGHGSMLLYSMLYLLGYPGMTVEQIRNFRQWGSCTPGHPEFGHTPGVETTTGPLGQGLACAVGMALAERIENARFGDALVDHRTYVVVGDGCLSEGISHEAASLAGHLGLSRLIVLFDDNGITIDGATSLSVSDDHLRRFESYGWAVDAVDGHSPEEVARALGKAQDSGKPSFIACKTVIGYGAPKKQGTEKAHGSPLGDDEIAAVREFLEWEHPPFVIPPPLLEKWREIGARGNVVESQWRERLEQSPHRQEWEKWRERQFDDAIGETVSELKQTLAESPQTIATRKASELFLSSVEGKVPGLVGGSADLSGSNNTKTKGQRVIVSGDFGGDYVHYGVREHAMGAVMNGMALHGLTPYGGTFLVFSDYCRPAMRMSALMGAHVIYVMTHDSIGLGEDGPTHQPVEHLASLRAMPGLDVYRPADAVETAECWEAALTNKKQPSVLALSRQNVPAMRLQYSKENLCLRGAYVLADADSRDLTILASGAEVAMAVEIAELLKEKGLRAAVVSFPCRERFERQDDDYQAGVLGEAPRFVVEAAAAFGWEKYAEDSHIFAMRSFGASAPAAELFVQFGFVPETIVEKIEGILGGE